MKASAIRRFRGTQCVGHDEHGITMILVAIAMVAIIAMAALSIDVVTLYLAREEAQRSADAAALAAARVISVSGITGAASTTTEPSYWQAICGKNSGIATQAAKAVGAQNSVGNVAATVTVTYSAGNGGSISSNTDCSSLSDAFGVNPMVTVQIQQTSLPTFFSRIWRSTTNTVSATATAEAFNPSNSGNVGNQTSGTITPVQPRCVKPWIVPNLDPLNPNTSCTSGANACQPFISLNDGHIVNPGISLNGTNSSGVIGERFLLIPNCLHRARGACSLRNATIQANHDPNGNTVPGPPNLEFLPGQSENASVAVPSAASGGSLFEKAIAGCDQTTVYYCGVPSSSPIGNGPNMVDLGIYPADDTTSGVQALINEGNPNPNGGQPTGQDYFNPSASPYGYPTAYPFQILPGSSNPLPGLASGVPITSSNSIVSVPIYDPANPIASSGTSPVTIVGFLQVFINGVDQYGNVDVVVLNVAGCSNGGGQPVASTAVTGSSPVPVRLITPP